ncbi:hypothetical protein ACLEEZ_00420 [Lonsdalea quercina]|uniref:hypothetical protein n=1 Tax=Lonsdalea quercina TaxID=71657 RepID=UPI003975FF2F
MTLASSALAKKGDTHDTGLNSSRQKSDTHDTGLISSRQKSDTHDTGLISSRPKGDACDTGSISSRPKGDTRDTGLNSSRQKGDTRDTSIISSRQKGDACDAGPFCPLSSLDAGMKICHAIFVRGCLFLPRRLRPRGSPPSSDMPSGSTGAQGITHSRKIIHLGKSAPPHADASGIRKRTSENWRINGTALKDVGGARRDPVAALIPCPPGSGWAGHRLTGSLTGQSLPTEMVPTIRTVLATLLLANTLHASAFDRIAVFIQGIYRISHGLEGAVVPLRVIVIGRARQKIRGKQCRPK